MTNTNQPDPTRVATIAQQLVKILAKEDSVTRQRAISSALTSLGEQSPSSATNQKNDIADKSQDATPPDMAAFFEREGKLKPSESAFLCAAYHYSIYGTASFSLEELRAIAQEAGVVIPDRVDMTLRNAGKGGKKLFQSAGRDAYRPTAAAGMYFKEKWNVRPGKKTKSVKESN